MNISVVIPALNEMESIGETVDSIKEMFKQTELADEWEIIIVNDGSKDETATVAEKHGARVINHLQNLGYGRSLKDGIEAACFDTIVITDADSTYPVNRIPDLIEHFSNGYHMVVGQRTGDHYRESFIKMPLRKILKWLVELTASRKIPDINSGLRIFDRQHAMKFFPRLCDTFSFTTSITLAYMMNNYFVHYFPIEYNERVGKTKVRLFKDSLRTLQYIVQSILYYDPMKIFVLMSAISVVFSTMCFGATLLFGFKSTFLMGVGGILVAMVIFAMGLLADLLKQIMHKIQ